MNGTQTFSQREIRYRLSRRPAETALQALAARLPIMTYSDGSSTTLVVTTYFDSHDHHYLRIADESDGECSLKVRLREYLWRRDDRSNLPLSHRQTAFLERKERTGDVRLKQRVEIHKRDVGAILSRTRRLDLGSLEAAAIDAELDARPLQPVMVSAYSRLVFGADDDLRITFDQRLGYYKPPQGLYDAHAALDPDVLGAPLARGPSRILEIKYAHHATLPTWLVDLFAQVPTANGFSKFREGMRELSGSDGRPITLTRPVAAFKE